MFSKATLMATLATLLISTSAASAEPAAPSLDTHALLSAPNPENVKLAAFLNSSPQDPNSLAGKRLAILTTDGVENIEITAQLDFFHKRGATVDIVAPRFVQPDAKWGLSYPSERVDHILTVRYMENAEWIKIDRFLEDVTSNDYDALVIAGGTWNPDALRITPKALELVRAVYAAGKVTAAICHGPLVFVNAGILNGKIATATWNVQLDIKNAGAKLVDIPVAVDGNLITSRHPLDLPEFLPAIERALERR